MIPALPPTGRELRCLGDVLQEVDILRSESAGSHSALRDVPRFVGRQISRPSHQFVTEAPSLRDYCSTERTRGSSSRRGSTEAYTGSVDRGANWERELQPAILHHALGSGFQRGLGKGGLVTSDSIRVLAAAPDPPAKRLTETSGVERSPRLHQLTFVTPNSANFPCDGMGNSGRRKKKLSCRRVDLKDTSQLT